jgi:hypothetical protein
VISERTDDEGYAWFVPVALVPGTDYHIRVTSISDSSLYDYSDSYFSISEGSQSSFGGLLELGIADFAEAADHSELDVGDDIDESLTIEAWVYIRGLIDIWPGISRNIVNKPQSNRLHTKRYDQPDIPLWRKYACFGLSLSTRGVERCETPHSYRFTWHHVAGVFSKDTAEMRIYVDGEAFAESSGLGIVINNTTESLRVGEELSGGVDEVRISDVARYTGETYTIPTSPFTCDINTRALWHFDEGEGATVFHDACGADNALTKNGVAQSLQVYLPIVVK